MSRFYCLKTELLRSNGLDREVPPESRRVRILKLGDVSIICRDLTEPDLFYFLSVIWEQEYPSC